MTLSNGKGDVSDRTAPKLTLISVRVKWVQGWCQI